MSSVDQVWDVIIVGSGNAALCAGLAAREKGSSVLVIEKADETMAGGNTQYTAGAMRFAYATNEDILPLLLDPDDERLPRTDFGSYTTQKFADDLRYFNDGRPLSREQERLVSSSLETLHWLASHDVKFEPIYARQSFLKEGRHVFWGGLTLAAEHEGVGLFEAERRSFLKSGGEILYDCAATAIVHNEGVVTGLRTASSNGEQQHFNCKSLVLACGGFESSQELRQRYLGEDWAKARVRGTPHNTGDGLTMALELGAQEHGFYPGCHATPMDLHMKEYGNLDIPHAERKHYRKICYFLGVMVNAHGKRFVDEGMNFRNYTYAQFGRAILEQPGHFAWQVFDAKVTDLLYAEYRFHDAHFVEAETLDAVVEKLDGVDKSAVRKTLAEFNAAVDESVPFDPTVLDGKAARGINPPRSNWAQALNEGPFRAYPVTCGITFTYGGLKVSDQGQVLRKDDTPITGLYACGELVGGVFFNGYPGGSGLTSGAVFGRMAGYGAAEHAQE